jgi:two-component system, sensor histidine kinase and response regulator
MSPGVMAGEVAIEAPTETFERVKILLVDDQPENLLAAEAVLESLGQQIVKAESGREALRHLLDNDFAVIVLDIMMPEMDGFETAALIRQRERSRHTPIIFLTALGRGEEHIRIGYDLGAVDYIVKPFVPEILRTKVAVFVELHRKSILLQQQSELLERRNRDLQDAIEHSRKAEQEIKALNRHLEQRLVELAEMNRELEAFSFTVSHDLRGPLSRIAGFSRALLDFHSLQLDETGRTYLERIDHSSTRMCELVEDLLRFSRIPRVEMSQGKVDLSEMARSIAAELQLRDGNRQVRFEIPGGIEGWGDKALLHTVIANLMENAWKYTRKRETGQIEFGTLGGSLEPVYYMRDNGAGFDMADVGRLFNPFQRLHKQSDFEGTGIGLATIDRIIRRHGGRVWAQGEVDQGATFFFTLGKEGSS